MTGRSTATVLAAAATVALVLGGLAGCGGDESDQSKDTPAASQCAGQDKTGSVHVLQGGTFPLPGGGRAGYNSASMDDKPPSAVISLLDAAPGEPASATVRVGDTVTVQRRRYQVVEICAGRVALLPVAT